MQKSSLWLLPSGRCSKSIRADSHVPCGRTGIGTRLTAPKRARGSRAVVGRTPRASSERPLLPIGLDEGDLQILAALTDDARLSQRALARLIKMSPGAVAERVTRLEASGIILSYQAKLNYEALDRSMTVFVGITSVQGEDQRQLAADLLALPVVETVDIVMGPFDLIVRLRVRDRQHLREVFFDALLPMPGVHRTESYIILESMSSAGFAGSIVQAILKTTQGGAEPRTHTPSCPA